MKAKKIQQGWYRVDHKGHIFNIIREMQPNGEPDAWVIYEGDDVSQEQSMPYATKRDCMAQIEQWIENRERA